jgi:hypothetical protein
MEDTNAPVEGDILSRYNELVGIRAPYLDRAKKYSKITLPYLIPEEGDNAVTEMLIDYAGVGSEYVNHLSNTYVDEMFPAHRSFFKLQMPVEEMKEAEEGSGEDSVDIEALFALTENEARWKFEKKHARVAILDHIKQLIVAGNALLYALPDEELVQNYAIDEYVMYRDLSGKLLEIITVDKKALMSLDADLRAQVIAADDAIDDNTDMTKHHASIYTYIRRDKDNPETFLVDQALEAVPIGEQSSYKEHLLPWIPTYWNRVRRETWGRGLVEDHYGAFYAMSILVEALVTAGAISTDYKFLVKPGSMVDVVEMNNAASGTYHYGNPEDVNVIDMGKRDELDIVMQLVDMYRKQLGKIFLVLSSQMRDAERVTAQENRMRAAELNKAHGGVFGNLALTLQAPMATLILRDVDVLVEDSSIEPVILTGLDAMGRASDNEKILNFFEDLAALNSVPEQFLARLNSSALMTKLGTGRDIDTSIVKSEDDYLAEQQAKAKAQEGQIAGEALIDKSEPEDIAAGMNQQ